MKQETVKMTIAVGFTIAVLAIYSIWNYYHERDQLLAQIDKQLYSAAVAVPFVLEDDFHDRTISATSISEKEDYQNIRNLTKLNDQLGTKFLYTVIQDRLGIYRLTSSSALASELKEGTEVRYFTPYPDASEILKDSFKNLNTDYTVPNKIYKPSYIPIFKDRWGTYRSIVLPIQTEKGNVYVVGVDMDISYVNTVLKQNTIQTLLSFLLFIIAIIPIVVVYSAMLKRKHNEYQKVHKLYVDHSKKSVTDPLTELFNRYKLDSELGHQYESFQRGRNAFAVLLIDLDHFKKINDQYGHQIGDEVLQNFAQTLKECSRVSDTVGRWGGEEFMVIYPNSDLEKAYLLAQKIHTAIKDSKELSTYKLTASIGVGISKQYVPLKQFIHNVDEALYEAKQRGRDQTIKVS